MEKFLMGTYDVVVVGAGHSEPYAEYCKGTCGPFFAGAG